MVVEARSQFRDGFAHLEAGLADIGDGARYEHRASGPFMVALLRKDRWEGALKNLERYATPWGDVVCPVAVKSLKPRHRKSSSLVTTRVPLLLGYALFRLPNHRDWRHVLLLEGVQTVLRCGEEPSLVPAHVVKRLAPMKELALSWEGRTVEFVEGPMAGFWGQYVSGRVLVDFFGRAVPIEAHPATLKPK